MISSHTLREMFIKKLMRHGKRQTSERIVQRLETLLGSWEPIEKAIILASPTIITRSLKRGASRYQVPVIISQDRQYRIGLQWLVQVARGKSQRGIVNALLNEIRDLNKEQGATWKRKMEVHKMALANRAWLNYRW